MRGNGLVGRLLCCAGWTLVLGCSSSLGGQPSPTPYHCGTAAAGHCYAEAFLGSHATGFRTTVTVANRFLPGDIFITNEFWLTNYNGNNGWIEIGYQYQRYLEERYFWAQLDPDTTNFTSHEIAPVPAEDIGTRVTIDVHQIGDNQFQLSLESGSMSFTMPINLHLWDGTYGGTVKVGTELAGSTGAQASLAEFVDNQVYDTSFQRHFVTELAGPDSIDSPPYGGWLQQPSDAAGADGGGSPGGVFSTYCCAP
jgi:hypothetical protein